MAGGRTIGQHPSGKPYWCREHRTLSYSVESFELGEECSAGPRLQRSSQEMTPHESSPRAWHVWSMHFPPKTVRSQHGPQGSEASRLREQRSRGFSSLCPFPRGCSARKRGGTRGLHWSRRMRLMSRDKRLLSTLGKPLLPNAQLRTYNLDSTRSSVHLYMPSPTESRWL